MRYTKPRVAVLNTSLPISRKVLLALPVNEMGGQRVRDYGPLKRNGAPDTGSLVWVKDRYGTTLAPDGTYALKSPLDATTLGVKHFTISVRFKRSTASTTVGFLSWDTTATGASGAPFVLLNADAAGTVRWYFDTNYRVSGIPHVNGDWHHHIATFDGATYRAYYDGKLQGSYASTTLGNLANGNAMYFGVGFNGYGVSRLDHLTVWSRALGTKEIAQITADPFAIYAKTKPFSFSAPYVSPVASFVSPSTNTTTQEQARGILTSLYPPGDLYDWDTSFADVYKYIDGLAASLKKYGYDMLDTLKVEFNPATCVEKLPDWEAALGLTTTAAAQSGTNAQRENNIVGKLRESGASTLSNIQQAVAPTLGYANPSDLVIYETTRSALTTAHTISGSPGSSFTNTPTTQKFFAYDGFVSVAGVQLTISLTHANVENVTVVLTNPSGTTATWTNIGTGSVTAQSFVLYDEASTVSPATGFEGKPICGQWSLSVSASAGTGTLVSYSWFGEGGGTGGLGGDIYTWGVYADPALVGSTASPDYAAALSAIRRLQPAHTFGYLIRSITSLPDVATTLPDACIPL